MEIVHFGVYLNYNVAGIFFQSIYYHTSALFTWILYFAVLVHIIILIFNAITYTKSENIVNCFVVEILTSFLYSLQNSCSKR